MPQPHRLSPRTPLPASPRLLPTFLLVLLLLGVADAVPPNTPFPPSPSPPPLLPLSTPAPPAQQPPRASPSPLAPLLQHVFAKYAAPRSLVRFDPTALSPPYHASGSYRLFHVPRTPPHLRGYLSSWRPFSYTLRLSPARLYVVRIHLLERAPCRFARRLFRVRIGSVHSETLDVFRRVGCRAPLAVRLPARAGPDGLVVIDFLRVRGAGPVVSCIQAFDAAAVEHGGRLLPWATAEIVMHPPASPSVETPSHTSHAKPSSSVVVSVTSSTFASASASVSASPSFSFSGTPSPSESLYSSSAPSISMTAVPKRFRPSHASFIPPALPGGRITEAVTPEKTFVPPVLPGPSVTPSPTPDGTFMPPVLPGGSENSLPSTLPGALSFPPTVEPTASSADPSTLPPSIDPPSSLTPTLTASESHILPVLPGPSTSPLTSVSTLTSSSSRPSQLPGISSSPLVIEEISSPTATSEVPISSEPFSSGAPPTSEVLSTPSGQLILPGPASTRSASGVDKLSPIDSSQGPQSPSTSLAPSASASVQEVFSPSHIPGPSVSSSPVLELLSSHGAVVPVPSPSLSSSPSISSSITASASTTASSSFDPSATPTSVPDVCRAPANRSSNLRVALAPSSFSPPVGTQLFPVGCIYPSTAVFHSFPSSVTPEIFRHHVRNRAGFILTTHVAPSSRYLVRMGFLEHGTGCVNGKRVFQAIANGVSTGRVDVFSAVGCAAPHNIWLHGVAVGADGVLRLQFKRISGWAPFLSNFEVRPEASGPTIAPKVDRIINVGPNGKLENTRGAWYKGTLQSVPDGVPEHFFRSARYGQDFTYSFNLAPGAYDVTVGFAEFYSKHCDVPGQRVFSVHVNGAVQLEGYDIFADVGCFVGKEIVFSEMTVGAVDTQPLQLRFISVTNNAVVSYIRVKTASKVCVPASTSGEISADHAAHAVPGSYPAQIGPNSAKSYVDRDGDGFVDVRIDGSGSHTHFFDSANGVIGYITEYTWSLVETSEVLSKSVAFTYRFPLGTTRIKLSVRDNSCTTDEAETTVTVTGKMQPGAYCYYYQDLAAPPAGGTLGTAPYPSFADISNSLSVDFSDQLPFKTELFIMRCLFFLDHQADPESVEVAIDTAGSGNVKLYKGEDLMLDSKTSSSAETELSAGLTALELIYQRTTTSVKPTLKLLLDGAVPDISRISHDQGTVLPVLTELSPMRGRITSDMRVRLSGYGLYRPISVSFGTEAATVEPGGDPLTVFVKMPNVDMPGIATVTASNPTGASSNALSFDYAAQNATVCDGVAFDNLRLTAEKDDGEQGDVDFLQLPTCATLAPDGRLFVGTLGGTVQAISYDALTLRVSGRCFSEKVGDETYRTPDGTVAVRDILGITFKPGENDRVYVSTATLYWMEKGRVDMSDHSAWRNGAVDRLSITPGLPVSNHDHAINGLVFNDDGDLLISVGGMTNLGLPGWKLGATWEAHLSAAVVIARTSKPDFNGTVVYSGPDEPHAAMMMPGGDVGLFATGLRNVYGMTITRSGTVFGVDQGPNCKFGDAASACDEYDAHGENDWRAWRKAEHDVQGRVRKGWKACPYGPGRKNKLLEIKQGQFYGHANLQRGECAWIDPLDGRTIDDAAAPGNYEAQVAMLASATTGVVEYTAGHFCGAMRGELVVSAYKGLPTWRVGRDGKTEQISGTGGLSVVEDAWGNLLLPRLTKKEVVVLRPRASGAADVFVAGVWPRRVGMHGGEEVRVLGWGFSSETVVEVGGKSCEKVRGDGGEIVCRAPAGSGLVDVVVKEHDVEVASQSEAIRFVRF